MKTLKDILEEHKQEIMNIFEEEKPPLKHESKYGRDCRIHYNQAIKDTKKKLDKLFK